MSLDPRKTNEKAYHVIYFGPQKVPFEGTARLLGVPLDFQLTFGQDTDELKKRSGRLKGTPMSLESIFWPEPVVTQVALQHLFTVLHIGLRIILASIHRC